jgi:hypothetical protein
MTASFRTISVDTASQCQSCQALVADNTRARDAHAEWHQTLDRVLDPAPLPFQCAICFGPVDADGDTCGTCADLANDGLLS